MSLAASCKIDQRRIFSEAASERPPYRSENRGWFGIQSGGWDNRPYQADEFTILNAGGVNDPAPPKAWILNCESGREVWRAKARPT